MSDAKPVDLVVTWARLFGPEGINRDASVKAMAEVMKLNDEIHALRKAVTWLLRLHDREAVDSDGSFVESVRALLPPS